MKRARNDKKRSNLSTMTRHDPPRDLNWKSIATRNSKNKQSTMFCHPRVWVMVDKEWNGKVMMDASTARRC
jgi:hypothetical protein